jgi:hypothetical protein
VQAATQLDLHEVDWASSALACTSMLLPGVDLREYRDILQAGQGQCCSICGTGGMVFSPTRPARSSRSSCHDCVVSGLIKWPVPAGVDFSSWEPDPEACLDDGWSDDEVLASAAQLRQLTDNCSMGRLSLSAAGSPCQVAGGAGARDAQPGPGGGRRLQPQAGGIQISFDDAPEPGWQHDSMRRGGPPKPPLSELAPPAGCAPRATGEAAALELPWQGQRQPSVEICFDDGEGPEAQEHLDRAGGQQTARPVASHECEGLVGGLGAEPGAEALVAAGDGVDVEWEGSGRSQGCGEAAPWGMDVSFEEDASEPGSPASATLGELAAAQADVQASLCGTCWAGLGCCRPRCLPHARLAPLPCKLHCGWLLRLLTAARCHVGGRRSVTLRWRSSGKAERGGVQPSSGSVEHAEGYGMEQPSGSEKMRRTCNEESLAAESALL